MRCIPSGPCGMHPADTALSTSCSKQGGRNSTMMSQCPRVSQPKRCVAMLTNCAGQKGSKRVRSAISSTHRLPAVWDKFTGNETCSWCCAIHQQR
jgi:hypothetical protein